MKSMTSGVWVLFTILMGLLQGCSVGLALHGAENPDVKIVKEGISQYDVEMELGKPDLWLGEERRAQYNFTTGESGSAGRAVAHAAGDLLTCGLWEVIGTPIEAVQSHDKWFINVWYDEKYCVAKWEGPRRR